VENYKPMKLFFAFVLLFFTFAVAQQYKVNFQLKTGNITLNIERAWAPLGVDRFMQLVKENYYNDNAFFRVVPNFVVQFGINGDPKISGKWRNSNIKDDRVTKSNLRYKKKL
jgi:cyclophilin family peptidyl-prolyl cis-trans isomerase